MSFAHTLNQTMLDNILLQDLYILSGDLWNSGIQMARSGSYYALWRSTNNILCPEINYKESVITNSIASGHDTGIRDKNF